MPAEAYLREAAHNVHRFFFLIYVMLGEWELTPD